MKLTDFRTLGRSGLIVSPLALGTMTFGATRWGSSDEVSRAVFHAYVDAGGTFIDTADVYSAGRSEELIGQVVADSKLRDALVLASKFSFTPADQRGNPNGGGNGRKNIHRALEGSLKRLQTDYLDLYWLHAWDAVTPAEEVLQTLGDLVRAGSIRYFGLSNVPAWYAAKMATLAAVQGVPGPVALQLQYSLVARDIEAEYLPAARDLGLGLTPWSPLAGGFLAGSYSRDRLGADRGRLSGPNPFGDSKFTEHNWRVLDALKQVAAELGRPPAQVALAWVVQRAGVTSMIIGASRAEQLHSNLASLDVEFTPAQLAFLNKRSAAAPRDSDFSMLKRAVFAGASVDGWH
ncbi:aldo/keto reductase [Deinococcus sp.]|uniref:aldo/keto reductase n=1 Tax=Deinococcus sp. TaxID=47478 RepID=UPI003CC6ACDB